MKEQSLVFGVLKFCQMENFYCNLQIRFMTIPMKNIEIV